jgi:quercetin dioxygenase-like cupin family protein
MKVVRARMDGPSVDRTGSTFTGHVLADNVLRPTDGVVINSVLFNPGARTHWHRHEHGQILHVTSGEGRVMTREGETDTIRAGDVVFFQPGEEHWHGASATGYMVHLAISLGETEWLEEVVDETYERVA